MKILIIIRILLFIPDVQRDLGHRPLLLLYIWPDWPHLLRLHKDFRVTGPMTEELGGATILVQVNIDVRRHEDFAGKIECADDASTWLTTREQCVLC